MNKQEEKFPLEMPYIDNERSMGRYMYKCAFFVAQKPVVAHNRCGSKSDEVVVGSTGA